MATHQLAKLNLGVPRFTSLKINWHCKVGKVGIVWMFKTSVSNPSFILIFSDWGQNWELSVGTLDQRLSLDMSRIREGGGGGPPMWLQFLGGGLQFFFGATPTEFQTYHRNPQLKPSRLAPFWSKLGIRGGLWTFPKVRGTHTRCRPRGESSQ